MSAMILPTERSKYGNKRTVVDGQTFDSMREAEHFRELLIRKHATAPDQRIVTIELQPRFELHALGGAHTCDYVADFRVTYENGIVEVIDVKSPVTRKLSTYRIKKKWMRAEYGIIIKEIE